VTGRGCLNGGDVSAAGERGAARVAREEQEEHSSERATGRVLNE
jgi:hypothetical protein